MKDLDFDELDQAVSSVLGNDTSDEKQDARPDTTAGGAARAVMPTPVTPAVTLARTAPTTPTPVASPAVRRRGQFLDMVHPSADMTSRSPVAPTARRHISPVSKDISASPTSEERAEKSAAMTTAESEPTPTITPAIPEEISTPSTTSAAPATEADATADPVKKDVAWPDPLDLTSTLEEPAVSAEEPVVAEVETPEIAMPEPKAEAVSPETSSTPFVTDAKVDKRPLGAFGLAEAPVEPIPPAKSDLDEQRPPDVTPPELQPDVVSVEAADKEFAPEEPGSETPASSGLSQSIPQQYHTPADAPDQTPHPIFDTNEYHQPLLPATHPKKKRGWLIVIIIVALLVVGSALGYFAFVAGF
jgi:hypothetical protein